MVMVARRQMQHPWYVSLGGYRPMSSYWTPPLVAPAMPRKRLRSPLSIYDILDGDPTAGAIAARLVVFDELAVLSPTAHKQLVDDLTQAVRYWRGGIKAVKCGVSNGKVAQQIFLSDVKRALERAGLPAKRWRKRYDDGDGPSDDAPESFYFGLAREVAAVCGKALPKDLKLPGQRAAKHQYGMMSPAMKAAQEAQLKTRQQQRGADLKLIMAELEFIRQQPASAKTIRPKLVPGPIPKAIADRTREEMEMGKRMNVYHASRHPTPRKRKP